VAAGDYQAAFMAWARTLNLVKDYSSDIDNYNFLVFETRNVLISRRTLLDNGQ